MVTNWQKDESWFAHLAEWFTVEHGDREIPVGIQEERPQGPLEKVCGEEARPKPEGRCRRQSLQRSWRRSNQRGRREIRGVRGRPSPQGAS